MRLFSKSALAVLTLLSSTVVCSQPVSPEPNYTISSNLGAVSDYRFRGLTQTSYNPSVQGGLDFSHKNGIYAGIWSSEVQWIKNYVGASAGDVEIDVYGGYKGKIAADLNFDVGVIGYQYPSNTASKVTGFRDADTTEIYIGLSHRAVSAKYSYSTDNFLANANSTGARYFEIAATFDLGQGFSLTPHAGYQTIPNQTNASRRDAADYSDYALTINKDFGKGISASLTGIAVVNADQTFYTGLGDGKLLSKNGWVAGIKYSF